MNVIVLIEGREAISVRALPWLTGWHFSAAEVAEALAGDLNWPEAVSTYRLESEAVGPFERRLWLNIHVMDLEYLATKELDSQQWRLASTQALPACAFVWRDEWESAYNKSPDGPDALRELAESADDFQEVQDRTLNFDPDVPPELAELVLEEFNLLTPMAGGAQARQVVQAVDEPEPNRAAWSLTKPKRFQGYTEPLYLLLEEAHIEGKSRPTARDILQAFAKNQPSHVAKVIGGESLDYYIANGKTKTANLKAIAATITGMTGKSQD